MGLEMLINAVLKAVGFRREQLDEAVTYGRTEFEAMKARAIRAEELLSAIARGQLALLKHFDVRPEVAAPDTAQIALDLPQLDKE